MSENTVIYARPLLSNHSLNDMVFTDNKSCIDRDIYRKQFNRKFIGKYCIVDWLDDASIIDCSLIHEWD